MSDRSGLPDDPHTPIRSEEQRRLDREHRAQLREERAAGSPSWNMGLLFFISIYWLGNLAAYAAISDGTIHPPWTALFFLAIPVPGLATFANVALRARVPSPTFSRTMMIAGLVSCALSSVVAFFAIVSAAAAV